MTTRSATDMHKMVYANPSHKVKSKNLIFAWYLAVKPFSYNA